MAEARLGLTSVGEFRQADRSMSRRELQARVRKAAGGFSAMGVVSGDTVALLMRNDIAFLEASLAATHVGAYTVPISWHSTPSEVAYILEDSGAKILVAHADLLVPLDAGTLAQLTVFAVEPPSDVLEAYRLDPVTVVPQAPARNWSDWLQAQDAHAGQPKAMSQSMLYTSGTTGKPKGVRRLAPTPEQQRLMAETRRTVYGVVPDARILLPGPLYHGAPNGIALSAAATAELLVLMARFEPEALLGQIEKHRITSLFMVPTMFVRLLGLPAAARRRYDLSSLRFVLHAAAPCPADVKRRMIEWWGPVINEFYGGTETGPIAFGTSGDWLERPGTVGKPTVHAVVRILDENGDDCPAGVPGEIFARLGHYPDFTYHGLEDRRREIERGGLVTLGDVGYRDEAGFLFLCDRKRDMVIIGGANVYPAEVESVLSGMTGVKDCAVFGIPDAEYGEALLALVEPYPDAPLEPAAIKAFLKGRLSGFKLPRHVEIRTELPRQDSGKIQKRLLREPYWRQADRHI